MESFEQTLTTLHLVAAGALAVGVVAAAARAARWRSRVPIGHAGVPGWVRVAKVASVVGVLAAGAGSVFAATVLMPLAPIAAPYARGAFFGLLALWVVLEIALGLSVPAALARGSRWRAASVAVGAAAAVALAVFLWRPAPAVLAYPGAGESVALALPFEGRWIAAHAGAALATNHHVRVPAQRYAADLAALGPGGALRRGERDDQADSYTFGAAVYAPVAGRVAAAVDGHPDGAIPEAFEDIAGNHVFIEAAPGRYVLLAHFQRGSVAVAEGDTVAVGDLVGRAGNSGNSDMPHLHVHVQDRPAVSREATAYPYHFTGYRRVRGLVAREVASSGVLRNDVMEPLGE